MDPSNHKKPLMGDMMGHIPRKKKKPSVVESGVASTPITAASTASADAPIPRKPKAIQRRPSREGGDASSSDRSLGGSSLGNSVRGGSNDPSERSVSSRPPTSSTASSSHSSSHGSSSMHSSSNNNGGGGATKKFSRLKPYTGATSKTSLFWDDRGNFTLPPNPRLYLVSESPFVLHVNTHGLPRPTAAMSSPLSSPLLDQHSSELGRSASKRIRSAGVTSYKEAAELDADDIMTAAEEEALLRKRAKKKRKTVPPSSTAAAGDTLMGTLATTAAPSSLLLAPPVPVVESPPSGVLNTLWYSRECYLHVFVMEKICGWKTRPRVQLVPETAAGTAAAPPVTAATTIDGTMTTTEPTPTVDCTTSKGSPLLLDPGEAVRLQQKAMASDTIWLDPKRRMEVSRIHPGACPTVLAMAAADASKQWRLQEVTSPTVTTSTTTSSTADASSPTPPTKTIAREDVLLVKWRGRSHWHCSWERPSDIQRLDPSTNNTARNKVRRYYQTQEGVYGPHWKIVLDDERRARPVHAGDVVTAEGDPLEEYFSPQCLEVEQILACDENEMNMDVLAKQRALNMNNEEEEVVRKESDANVPQKDSIAVLVADWNRDEQKPWDPEDNVRYVVKWKGLPYAEITWEYWRDIKRDAVDQAEDFWYRQRAPDLEEVRRQMNLPHPHMRDFQKLQESPAYGVSKKPRPVFSENKNGDAKISASDPGFRLRSYQLEGVNWLLFNWWNRRSCILADEMGLGKTIQSAAFLQELVAQPAAHVRGPFLVVAPLSLVGQWQSELASWAPDMNLILYHGSADARDFLVKQEFYYTDQFLPKATAAKLKKSHVTKFDVLITTYEVILKDIAVLSKIRWRTLIVDEAHRLKNHKSKLFEELAAVPRDHCVLLTGTPIANATEELWALLHFANPRTFNDRDDFLEKFGEMTDADQVNELHALLKPYLLRRVKEDVEKSLPNKEETILEVTLTPTQKTFYKAIYERNTSFLFKGAKPNNAPSLMNVMMELRKCCNHPFLIKGVEERILEEAASKLQTTKDEQGSAIPVNFSKLFEEQLVKSSGKMVLMEKLLQKLFTGGHKVLVFSQMVRVLDLLEELLKLKKYKYERLDGSTNSSSRLHAVERFKKKACQRFVMLLSTRAGGLGLNLTAADIVIIFDSDWNPQNDMQAMARAHRIGQTRAVKVYRLLTAKTYEMHMFHSASLKLGLERAVLSQNREQNADGEEGSKLTRKGEKEAQAKEIDELLKKGAYDVFRDEDDSAANAFMETDIDQLLENSSKKVTYGATSTSSLGSGLGSFSKASFVANTDEGEKDVDLDDPEFWSKAVGLDAPPDETPEDVAAMLDDGVKRSRKQVEQYDPYAETAMAEQLKKDRIILEKLLEKEEKERIHEEKKKKQKKAKDDRRKKDREEKSKVKQSERSQNSGKFKNSLPMGGKIVKIPKLSKEVSALTSKPRRSKKNDRTRSLRRAEEQDPVIEKFKQAWEIPQRNRATAAAIRFGFGRFCKLRNESNLSSLPLQDLEVFFRSYVYQLSLQVAVTLMTTMEKESTAPDIRLLLHQWIGFVFPREVDWLCDSIQSVIAFQREVESGHRFLRMPLILSEPVYVSDLRHGASFRALRRIGILARLNCFIEECLDAILNSLGSEELGKRGCSVNELSQLDADLKSRFVTPEELALEIGMYYGMISLRVPASWWDRNCDVGLIVGTFVHGFGNYEIIRRDQSLPFSSKIDEISVNNEICKDASQRFEVAAKATRQVFDDALEAGRIKAELEVQAAVAAAKKAEAQRAEDAALLRKGGAEAADAVRNMPDTQVEDAFVYDGTDSHFVTLPRMHESIQEAVTKCANTRVGKTTVDVIPEAVKSGDVWESGSASLAKEKDFESPLSMPDARVLDYRIVRVLDELEKNAYGATKEEFTAENNLWSKSKSVTTALRVRDRWLSSFTNSPSDVVDEYAGVGLGGSQCAISHRTLNDGSDFSFGSASSQLSQLAYGTDAPRYLRALAVPMNVTRFTICGLIYATSSCLQAFMEVERIRYYGSKSLKPYTEMPKDTDRISEVKAEASEFPRESIASTNSVKEDAPPLALKPDPETTTASANLALGEPRQRLDTSPKCSNDENIGEKRGEICDKVVLPPISDVKVAHTQTCDSTALKPPSKQEESSRPTDMNAENVFPVAKLSLSSNPVDPIQLMDNEFLVSSSLRANVCLAVVYYGFPASTPDPVLINCETYTEISSTTKDTNAPKELFNMKDLRDRITEMVNDVEVPSIAKLEHYIERTLLPHCVRLCVSGNGPSTRNARGSKGDYETAFGISIHPEPSQPHPTPIPDPCLPLQEHSLEALAFANALLRRVRLLQSCIHICSLTSSTQAAAILTVVKSAPMRQLQDMPIWWCPWIHDTELLFQAASIGLFSVVKNRSDSKVFSRQALQQFMNAHFVDSPDRIAAIKHASTDEVASWIEHEIQQFPSLNQLERRIGYLCGQLTATVDSEARFDHLPMFDHGGWPRN